MRWSVLVLLLSVVLVGCAPEVSDQEIEKELQNLSDEELDVLLQETEKSEEPIVGEAVRTGDKPVLKKPLEIAKYASAERKLPLEIAEYASAQPREFRRFIALEIVRRQEACGDDTIDHTEECDDGNKNNADGCSASCKVEGACIAINEVAQKNFPHSAAPNVPVEGGYAKQHVPVNTLSELKTACNEFTYNALFQIYCQKNTNPAPAQYRVILYAGDGSVFLTECDDGGCEYHPCAFPQPGTTPGIVAQE